MSNFQEKEMYTSARPLTRIQLVVVVVNSCLEKGPGKRNQDLTLQPLTPLSV